MRIYEIPSAMRQALEALEIDEETGEILNPQVLHQVEGEATTKIENTALFVRELVQEQEVLKAEAKRMLDRAKSLGKKEAYLKNLIQTVLEHSFNGKLKTSRLTCYVRQSSSVAIDNLELLPQETLKIKYEPDKTAIKQLLDQGLDVPGAYLCENQSLVIR